MIALLPKNWGVSSKSKQQGGAVDVKIRLKREKKGMEHLRIQIEEEPTNGYRHFSAPAQENPPTA